MVIRFAPAAAGTLPEGDHHARAAAKNVQTVSAASEAMVECLARRRSGGDAAYDRILLRAAAGAGKSYALRRLVADAVALDHDVRVGVTAFTNKQILPLAMGLGAALGSSKVCLFVGKERIGDVPTEAFRMCQVTSDRNAVGPDLRAIVATSHKWGASARWQRQAWGLQWDEPLFDVLFVDEAWQLPSHLYRGVEFLAPLVVGVGDVGQLSPIEIGDNPWRGDPGYNPYRAWPTAYEQGDPRTWVADLPAVWRPTAAQLPLWRAFYSDWDRLDCVAAPGDRRVDVSEMGPVATAVWHQVGSGVPTLLEVDGLPEPEAADIDLPLLGVVESLVGELVESGFSLVEQRHDDTGDPVAEQTIRSVDPSGDPLIVVLATRNQAVDDAADMVGRLTERLDLPDGVLVASTVDSWQGQTNRITVAIHPLSGADQLDEFNSAFGRLAVTCTRATHGLLMVARSGLDDLLANAPARPGTPLGEPGVRQLPRQTHERILATFARGTLTVTENGRSALSSVDDQAPTTK